MRLSGREFGGRIFCQTRKVQWATCQLVKAILYARTSLTVPLYFDKVHPFPPMTVVGCSRRPIDVSGHRNRIRGARTPLMYRLNSWWSDSSSGLSCTNALPRISLAGYRCHRCLSVGVLR